MLDPEPIAAHHVASWVHWVGFATLIVAMLVVDLVLLHRRKAPMSGRRALGAVGLWIAIGVGVGGVIGWRLGYHSFVECSCTCSGPCCWSPPFASVGRRRTRARTRRTRRSGGRARPAHDPDVARPELRDPLGLRSLYLAIAGGLSRFRHLQTGLAVILGFIGLKMLAHDVLHIPGIASLGVILAILGLTAAWSWRDRTNNVEPIASSGAS